MTAQPTPALPRMTTDEFLAWVMEQPQGRFELLDGEVVRMAAERAAHAITKIEAAFALRAAIRAKGLGCQVFGDGMAIRVSEDTVFEPDAAVRCGPRLPDDAVEIADPLIVVEVLSPSTAAIDSGQKLHGYLSLPSVRHYLILDAKRRTVIHHRRPEGSDRIETRLLRPEGPDLILDPPGLTIRCADLFETQ